MFKRNNLKYLGLAVATLFLFHWVLNVTKSKSGYSEQLPSSELLDDDLDNEIVPPRQEPKIIDHIPERVPHNKVKATFVVLIRNSDLYKFRATMRQLEDRFNRNYNYPYVFLNNEPFTEEFKKLTSSLTKAKTEYGLIPREHWSVPESIDMDAAIRNMARMQEEQVLYGDSLSYRHMCRFESGFFFRHQLLDKYDYYWRVEPGVKFFCDLDFDPFAYLKDNNIIYGFTVSLYEYQKTIPTLWDAVKEFIKKYPEFIEKDNMMEFLSNDGGESYNLCHFWSNFEIADLNFWRGEAYTKFFNFLDEKGGFFYERWGDAPVHSIAVALFLKSHQTHFFNEIGYFHSPISHCPTSEELQLKCHCDPKENFDYNGYSCTKRYFEVRDKYAKANATRRHK